MKKLDNLKISDAVKVEEDKQTEASTVLLTGRGIKTPSINLTLVFRKLCLESEIPVDTIQKVRLIKLKWSGSFRSSPRHPAKLRYK